MRIKYWPMFCLFCLVGPQSLANTLSIGVIEYPPYVNFDKDTLNEKAVKYVKQAFRPYYDQINFIKLPSKRAQAELDSGRLDLLLPLSDKQHNFKHLSQPLFHAVPGLCFKKKTFIPILSAVHRLNGLTIGVPVGTDVVPTLKNSGAILKAIEGSNTIDLGINLLLDDLIDVFYHPNPVRVYHYDNVLAKKIACSYFYGQSIGVNIAVSPKMNKAQFQLIDKAFTDALKVKSYEFYFAERE